MLQTFLQSWLKLTVAMWRLMATQIGVNFGSGNGLLPDGTKPLTELMLTNHHRGLVACTINMSWIYVYVSSIYPVDYQIKHLYHA